MDASLNAPVLYVRFRKRVTIPKGKSVLFSEIAQLIAEPELEERLRKLIVYEPRPQDGNLLVIDMMMVIRKVKQIAPNLNIELIGEPHALVEVVSGGRKPHVVLIVLVWLLLFIGSGLAIMNFHADVSMLKVHQRIYEMMTGKETEKPYFLQIPYSIGIGAGMVLFFNHLFKKKFNEEPSPLEVEMFMYQENVNHYVITNEYSKLQEKQGGAELSDERSN
ncbi:stage V sporulation protein AA [Paenibacillus contaminans]|uniref:Stage V sporulation protein AA n=1 Tax=Paenibacillus contaminans TaxID=450362 RepID=A0A329ML41_9BACL|nr:stage V sporulation protein AA [Paenibacillus contaminans]RAV18587.1 stage V sporulation protein AA [Paenibacillus contaminans]